MNEELLGSLGVFQRAARSAVITSIRATVLTLFALCSSQAVQAQDFDGDGFDDLAIGNPIEDFEGSGLIDAGAVTVLYGTGLGLSAVGAQLWHLDVAGVAGTAASGDFLGAALSWGDFDNDGFDDLAVNVRGFGDQFGAVLVLYGSNAGLVAAGSQLWHQDVAGVPGVGEAGDNFGWSLSVGDFDNDGFDDLAVGSAFEDFESPSILVAGVVTILYGSATGLTATGSQLFSQNTTGIVDSAELSDLFGDSLAAGDFDGDGFDDLAIGVTGEDNFAGAVAVIYGTAAGLATAGNQLFRQSVAGLGDPAETGDAFGAALAAGNFNGDSRDDLAVGVPNEDVVAAGLNEGAVNVIYGSAAGLSTAGSQFWHQDSPGIKGIAKKDNFFGASLAAGHFAGLRTADLAIGSPKYGNDHGVVHVLRGSAGGLTSTGNQIWHQEVVDVEGVAEPNDRFGEALTVGDYDGDTRFELAVGVPGEDGAGYVNVIYGTVSGLSAADDQIWGQNSPGVPGVDEAGDSFGAWLANR